jgi:hypothetical protein
VILAVISLFVQKYVEYEAIDTGNSTRGVCILWRSHTGDTETQRITSNQHNTSTFMLHACSNYSIQIGCRNNCHASGYTSIEKKWNKLIK